MGLIKPTSDALSRRMFAGLLGGALASRIGRADADHAEPISWRSDSQPAYLAARRYRAEAQVLVLGFPVWHREGVGGGNAAWREFDGGAAVRMLEFSGYSIPGRAAGVNRVGLFREMAKNLPTGNTESLYFGVMTSSPEESAAEARKALHSAAQEQTYTAIDGRIAGGKAEASTAQFTAPSDIAGEKRGELEDRARRALASAQRSVSADIAQEGSHSFLQAVAELLMRPNAAQSSYVYAGRRYRIFVKRSLDNKSSEYFRERRLIPASASVTRVSGKVRREADGNETEFHLWVRAGEQRPLPLRIEYQAKSYLRLVFEAEA